MHVPGQGNNGGGIRLGAMEYVGYAEDGSGGNTTSYGALTDNSPAAGRLYFCVEGRTSGQKTASGLTIGGVAATRLTGIADRTASFTPVTWFWFDHPGGALGAIVATFTGSGTMASNCVHCFRFSDFDDVEIVGGGSNGSDNSFTSQTISTIDAMLAGDWTISAYRFLSGGGSRTATWSNQTEVLDTYISGSPSVLGAAVRQQSADQAADTPIGVTMSGSVSSGPISTLIVRGK